MEKTNITTTGDISVTPRAIDFVTKFGESWKALLDIIGVSNMVKKEAGTNLYVRTGAVTLEDSPEEGEEITLSQATVSEKSIGSIKIEKYTKEVTIESIAKFGKDNAIDKTDKAFANALRSKVMNGFYNYIATAEDATTGYADNLQGALAKALGSTINTFTGNNLSASGYVGWCNVEDFYDYLGSANITVQNQFGYSYVKNFLGYDTLFLVPTTLLARDTVIATAIENVICYYIDPSDSDFAGFGFYSDAVTPIIGAVDHADYDVVGLEMTAVLGLVLTAEYEDGIAIVTVGEEEETTETETETTTG